MGVIAGRGGDGTLQGAKHTVTDFMNYRLCSSWMVG